MTARMRLLHAEANYGVGSTVDDDSPLDLFSFGAIAAEIEKDNAEAVSRALESGASLAPTVSNMLQWGIISAETSSHWQTAQAADVLILPDSPIDNAPRSTEPFGEAMSRTGHTFLGVVEGGWNRMVAELARLALSPLTSTIAESETLDLGAGVVDRTQRSPASLAFARQMGGYADFLTIAPRNDAQRLGQGVADVVLMAAAAYSLTRGAYNLTRIEAGFGEVANRGPRSGSVIEGEAVSGGGGAAGTVFSGHGGYEIGSGIAIVPEGTSLTVYSKFGSTISNRLGNVVETGGDLSKAYSRTYGPGERLPNYTLYVPGELVLEGAPVTVSTPTRVSELLKPGMGECHWAACTYNWRAQNSNLMFDTAGIVNKQTKQWITIYSKE